MSEQSRFEIVEEAAGPPAADQADQAGQAEADEAADASVYNSVVDGDLIIDPGLGLELPSGAELPEDPIEMIALLFEELASVRAAEAEALDKWKRTAAEFDNYRRRAQRDQADLISRSSERVASRMLPVLDSLDAALASEAVGSAEAGIREGLSGTRDLLLSVLAGEGLAPIEAAGAAFDPALHEAAQIGEGEGAMVVESELRRGYTLADRVVRASLVVVGYQPAEAVEAPAETPEAAGEAEGPEAAEDDVDAVDAADAGEAAEETGSA